MQQTDSFEDTLKKLEKIVETMETGKTTLDESLSLYQEATRLIQECGKKLEQAKIQVSKISASADGSPIEEAFTDE